MPEYIAQRYELGPCVAVMGKEGCEDVRCTRAGDRCIGYHCSRCGEPCSMMGHRDCPKLDPRSERLRT